MRRGYNRYLYRGTGVDSAVPNINLLIGLAVHKGQEVLLLSGGDVDKSRLALREEFAHRTSGVKDPGPTVAHQLDEGLHLSEALHMAWALTRYNDFIDEYEVISVEKESRLTLANGQVFMARADAVVRSRSDGHLYVFNWKTTKQKKDWNEIYQDDVQSWTEALVTEQELGEPIIGCIYEGFFKGVQLGAVYSSPLIYGFANGGEVSSSWKRGWNRFAAWKEPGLEKWFERLGAQALSDQLLRSTPVLKNDEVVREWIEQVIEKENAIDHVLKNGNVAEQRRFFWQNFSKWNCAGCPFRPDCRKQTTIEEMLKDGVLAPREDHHGVLTSSAGGAILEMRGDTETGNTN